MAAQWKRFSSERAFVRYAERHLRAAFPKLPETHLRRIAAIVAKLTAP
jgi:hypothetical protein